MAAPSKRSRLLDFALIFVVAYFGSQLLFGYLFPEEPEGEAAKGVFLVMEDETLRKGNDPIVTVRNDTDKPLQLPNRCPMPPFDVFRVTSPAGGGSEALEPLTTTDTAIPCEPTPVIAEQGEATVSLSPWKYSLFGELGFYEIRTPEEVLRAQLPKAVEMGSGTTVVESSTRFEIHEPGTFVKLFRTFITKPFLNFLVFIASLLPDHNLGIAIIILTLVVKLLLFWPTQKSLEGQKKMQLLQPKLEQLKKQYEGDPKKLQEETVKLWKAEKVNPFQSCLPILLQFPILIGLFYVVRDGTVLELSRDFLYPMYDHLTWDFNTKFLWLDLRNPDIYVLPALLVILQFLQMKLTFAVASRKAKNEGKETPKGGQQEMQQKIMTYVLPIMIGVFAFQFPAAVALYWGVSTIFAIGQQMIVNREHLRLKTKLPKTD